MIQQTLLRRAVVDRDPALVEFVETVARGVFTHFTTVPALGGAGKTAALRSLGLPADATVLTAAQLSPFARNSDQSLATHVLNGVFTAMRIAERLPVAKKPTDLEKRLLLLAFTAHDYTKYFSVQVAAGKLPSIRQLLLSLGEKLGYDAFLSGWRDYLDDIAFLAQNIQTVVGANLNVREFEGLRLNTQRLEVLRLTGSIADVLAHMSAPSDACERGADDRDRANNAETKLKILFGAERAPRFAYHQLSEVRGLLSNLINNAVMEQLSAQGYEPFLFFPNGVVYLADRGAQAQISVEQVAAEVWKRIVETAAESDAFIRPWTTGLLVSSSLYEFGGFAGVFAAARQRVLAARSNASVGRLYGYFTGKSENDLKQQYNQDAERIKQEQVRVVAPTGLPTDIRVAQLGEFLTLIVREIRDQVKGGPDISSIVLEELGLADVVTAEEARRQKGGTYFGWHYCAARFIQAHPTLDETDLADAMGRISARALRYLSEKNLVTRSHDRMGAALGEYITRAVRVDGVSFAGRETVTAGFAAELTRYTVAKAERKGVCSLCSSPFATDPQAATDVPFGPQQYSNKNPLAARDPWILRRICPICRIEMILRRARQETLAEETLPIQLFLYPAYFFTPETARVVRLFLNDLFDLELSPLHEDSLIRHLRTHGFSIESILSYEQFVQEPGKEPASFRRRLTMAPRYSDQDFAGVFAFSLKPRKPKGRELMVTDAWALPTLYALMLPVLLNVKVVVTPSFLPLLDQRDFRETVVLDAPHSFSRYALARDRFRVDEVPDYLIRLLRLYDLHLDVFADPTDLHWPQLNVVARDVATDPLNVFMYYDRKLRNRPVSKKPKKGGEQAPQAQKGIPGWDVDRYFDIYLGLGGEPNMGFIGPLVDAYAQFYRPEKLDSGYAVLRPLTTAVEVTVESDPATDIDDLLLLVAGVLDDDLSRMQRDHAGGSDVIWFDKSVGSVGERKALRRQKIEEFARLFLEKAFQQYCQGDRALLRERANRLRSAARFYYLKNYIRKHGSDKEDENGYPAA